MGRRVLLACVVALVAGGAIAAEAWALIVPIPGIAGPSIRLVAALRTEDGGAIMVASIRPAHAAGAGTTLTARLDAEGRLELGYGYEGVAALPLGPTVIPTALAVDPATGEAWIGATDGTRAEIIAVSPTGKEQPGFGRRGVVDLPAVDDGGVRALAWRKGELLVAAGARGRCTGCVLTVLKGSSGAPLARTTITRAATCTRAVTVTSVALTNTNGSLAATSVANPAACTPALLAFDDRLVPSGSKPLPRLPAQPLRTLVLTPEAGATCVAGTGPAGISVWPLGARRSSALVGGASVRLIALVPLGGGACGALLARDRRSGEVAQTAPSNSAASVGVVPASLVPLAMFRCHQHLLVIAADGPVGDQAAVIVPVRIARGPFAAAMRASRSMPSTGCA
jgi:hypothetical protein